MTFVDVESVGHQRSHQCGDTIISVWKGNDHAIGVGHGCIEAPLTKRLHPDVNVPRLEFVQRNAAESWNDVLFNVIAIILPGPKRNTSFALVELQELADGTLIAFQSPSMSG